MDIQGLQAYADIREYLLQPAASPELVAKLDKVLAQTTMVAGLLLYKRGLIDVEYLGRILAAYHQDPIPAHKMITYAGALSVLIQGELDIVIEGTKGIYS